MITLSIKRRHGSATVRARVTVASVERALDLYGEGSPRRAYRRAGGRDLRAGTNHPNG